jgi:hypothetical protein
MGERGGSDGGTKRAAAVPRACAVWGPVIPRASAEALAAADRAEQGRRRSAERLAALDAQRARVARDGCAMAALRHI